MKYAKVTGEKVLLELSPIQHLEKVLVPEWRQGDTETSFFLARIVFYLFLYYYTFA